MMCPFRGEEGLFSRLVEPWGSAPAGPGIVHGSVPVSASLWVFLGFQNSVSTD